jgi:hypothetical protein
MESHQKVLFVDATTGFYTEAALGFWYEVHKGTHEVLREF